MKTINILKIITGLLTIFILAGFILIISKLSEKSFQSKSVSSKTTTFSLLFEENITNVIPCGDSLCVMTDGYNTTGHRLVIINPKSGKISNVIQFTKVDEKLIR